LDQREQTKRLVLLHWSTSKQFLILWGKAKKGADVIATKENFKTIGHAQKSEASHKTKNQKRGIPFLIEPTLGDRNIHVARRNEISRKQVGGLGDLRRMFQKELGRKAVGKRLAQETSRGGNN